MADQKPLREIPQGTTVTYTESVLIGGSVTKYMVNPALLKTSEGQEMFVPQTPEEARTPLALLTGAYTLDEVRKARESGIRSMEIVGHMLSPGAEVMMSYAPLD